MTTSGSAAIAFVSFRDVMARVGEFLFYWSLLEQQLTDSIQEARQSLGEEQVKVKGTLAERLDMWASVVSKLATNDPDSDLIQKVSKQTLLLKKVRNIIVHGLCAGSSVPEEGEPHILCLIGGFEKPSGETVRYDFADLEHFTQGIDACRRGLRNIRNFNYLVQQEDLRLPNP